MLVDARPEVVWVPSERDLQQRQEAVHPGQQTLGTAGRNSLLPPRERFIWCAVAICKVSAGSYVLAAVLLEGMPSNTMTLSARYVAMMKSCSTTNAVFLAWRMYLKQQKRGVGPTGQHCSVRGEEGEGRAPLDDPGGHQSLLGVQVGRGLVDQVDVGWFAQTQREGDSLQLTTRQVLHLQAEGRGRIVFNRRLRFPN